jgi:glycerophosphoryl diester phosphodiesterase
MLLGHRGSPKQHLENTLPSFQAAMDAGLDGIELDVQRTRDGALVIHHDEHLPDGRLIAALEYHELRLPKQAKMPRLEEVLEWARGNGAFLNIEIKLRTLSTDGREAQTAALIERYGLQPQVLISSFNPTALWRVKRAAPGIQTALLFDNTSEPHWLLDDARAAAFLEVHALHPHHRLVTPALMTRAQRYGWKVNAWTVNDLETARKLIVLGVNGLVGDYPEVLLQAREAT